MNPILRRVPTLILFHDNDNDSSSGESNDLNQMEHPEMQLVESESISLIARDSMQEESSFDFNRI